MCAGAGTGTTLTDPYVSLSLVFSLGNVTTLAPVGGPVPSHARTSACTGWDVFCCDVIQLPCGDTLDDSVTKSVSLLFSHSQLIPAASFLAHDCCALITHALAHVHVDDALFVSQSASQQRICCAASNADYWEPQLACHGYYKQTVFGLQCQNCYLKMLHGLLQHQEIYTALILR